MKVDPSPEITRTFNSYPLDHPAGTAGNRSFIELAVGTPDGAVEIVGISGAHFAYKVCVEVGVQIVPTTPTQSVNSKLEHQ